MPNRLMPFDEVVKQWTADINKELAPVIASMKAQGMTDAEINLEINRAMFDVFKGLHGFPDSHRP